MSDNKFIERLKGKETAKSVLEVKNQATKLSFANMPQGTSNAIDVFSDHRGNATAVLNGTTNWKISNSNLLLATTVSGDGQDFISTYSVSGAGLWVNASYTFPSTGDPNHPVAAVFNPSTKWVLKVCGDNLIVDGGSTVDFTMLVKIGTANVYSKNFTIRESAGQFSKEFVIDFGEANSDIVKAGGLSTLTVQLLCGTANASARIYNGMTVLTCLQRKVDASAVSSQNINVQDVLDGTIIPDDYFSNPEFINQIEDGNTAVAIFARDGDDVNLDHWEQPIPDRTGNAGKFLQTPDGDKMSWEDVEISDVTGLQTELNDLQGQITVNKNTMDSHIGNTNNPHSVTKAQVGLGNVDNTSDLNKPISTATQTALNSKQDVISDLSTIRSGAALGATAVQPGDLATVAITGSYNDLSNKPTIPTVGNGTITITQGGITKGTFTTNQSGNTTIALDAGGGGGAVDSVNGKTGVVVLTATDVGALPDSTVIPDAQIQSDWNQADNTKVDFIKNKPTIPAAQVNSDWNANSGIARILNKPTIPTVNNPTITITQGGVTKGSFTLNQATGDTIALDAGGGSGSGYHPDLFDVKWADHIMDDAQWLMANPFSWQYGSMYQAAYANLSAAIAGKTLQSETVAGITVQFYLADDGHKICPVSEEDKVLSIYNKTGNAWYYIIDTTNQRFKLPRRHSQQIVRSVKNADGSWYRLYADGWVEQGGVVSSTGNVNLPVSFRDTSYQVVSRSVLGITKYMTYFNVNDMNYGIQYKPSSSDWMACGMAAIDMSSFQDGEKYLYFYVGAFTQTAIENTAGLNTELFNQKADLNLSNTASNIDFVVERQEPTAGNNYTWYRKYKSGWVEQGGVILNAGTGAHAITIPVEMASVDELKKSAITTPIFINGTIQNQGVTVRNSSDSSWSTTQIDCYSWGATIHIKWQVSGMAAN